MSEHLGKSAGIFVTTSSDVRNEQRPAKQKTAKPNPARWVLQNDGRYRWWAGYAWTNDFTRDQGSPDPALTASPTQTGRRNLGRRHHNRGGVRGAEGRGCPPHVTVRATLIAGLAAHSRPDFTSRSGRISFRRFVSRRRKVRPEACPLPPKGHGCSTLSRHSSHRAQKSRQSRNRTYLAVVPQWRNR